MLRQRLRRWPKIEPALSQFVVAGLWTDLPRMTTVSCPVSDGSWLAGIALDGSGDATAQPETDASG